MTEIEPGLDLHEWETRWAELEEAFQADPAGALPEACDVVEQQLGDTDWSDDLERALLAARETADRLEQGEDVDPGDVGAAIENLRLIRRSLSASGADDPAS